MKVDTAKLRHIVRAVRNGGAPLHEAEGEELIAALDELDRARVVRDAALATRDKMGAPYAEALAHLHSVVRAYERAANGGGK